MLSLASTVSFFAFTAVVNAAAPVRNTITFQNEGDKGYSEYLFFAIPLLIIFEEMSIFTNAKGCNSIKVWNAI